MGAYGCQLTAHPKGVSNVNVEEVRFTRDESEGEVWSPWEGHCRSDEESPEGKPRGRLYGSGP